MHLLNAPPDYEGKREDWSQYEAPERLKKAIATSAAASRCADVRRGAGRTAVLVGGEWRPCWRRRTVALPDISLIAVRGCSAPVVQRAWFRAGGGAADCAAVFPAGVQLPHHARDCHGLCAGAFAPAAQVMQSHCGQAGLYPGAGSVRRCSRTAVASSGACFASCSVRRVVATEDVTLLSAQVHPRNTRVGGQAG